MKNVILSLATVLLMIACGGPTAAPVVTNEKVPVPPAPDALANYRGLIGDWVDHGSPKFTCFERWTAVGDSILSGFGYVMAKGDTVFIEDLRIASKDGRVIYSARIESQNNGQWVPFTAEGDGADSLVFENPGHDFPQCISYVKDSTGAWDVAVTGNENGIDRAERFRFVRM